MNRFFRSYWLVFGCILYMQSGCSAKKPALQEPAQKPPTLADLEVQLALREDQLRNSGVSLPPSETAQELAAGRADNSGSKQKTTSAYAAQKKAEDQVPEPATEAREYNITNPSRIQEQTSVNRCEQICQITTALCDLETKICQLADSHPNDTHYQDVCDRAHEDCQIANEACHACHQ